jgi:hypothetical protein
VLRSAPANISKSVYYPDLYEASINELQDGLTERHFTSVDLVKVGVPTFVRQFLYNDSRRHTSHVSRRLTGRVHSCAQ